MTLLTVTLQIHLALQNILDGLIWFFLPCSLVILNDVFAYIFGFFFGKTQLIRVSPKKTVEGFIGGALSTLVIGFLFSSVFSKSDYFICPIKDIYMNIFNFRQCTHNPVFDYNYYTIMGLEIPIAPIQFHSIILVCFASLVAPFGGFFASGVKRAFKIKDFADVIPGHGGITDRLDCQFAMGVFSNLYLRSFIRVKRTNISHLFRIATGQLELNEIVILNKMLQDYLNNKQ